MDRSGRSRNWFAPISFALSVNKTVSKIATVEGTAGKPGNTTRETEKQFLNPLSIKKYPWWVT
jgi:DNA polymerase-4